MFHHTKRFDRWLHSHLPLLLLLLLLIFLRIPNFFEPYWYGDEGIYLTIGNALRQGERLYTDIVDHKTPIIYLLASVPNQFSFRVLNLFWMMITTTAFYAVGKKLLKKQLPLVISTFVFILLTSLPWFEGNIPNGELFAMGFILVGGWLLTKTALFDFFLNKEKALTTPKKDWSKLYLVGFCFGLAVMTKVPAVFDVVAWLTIAWFILTKRVNLLQTSRLQFWQLFSQIGLSLLFIGAGILTPILISIIYFIAIGSGQDYLQFGLLYNLHYTANWGLPFSNPILIKFFTLPGKIVIAAVIYLILTLKAKKLQPQAQLIGGWFILALVGALLSNRPYPHYFQQLFPALALLIGLLIVSFRHKSHRLSVCGLGLTLLGLFVSALILLDFGAYPAKSYYQNFYQLLTLQISPAAYRQSFNYLMTDNYQAAKLIKQSATKEIFIWGTNPMLYAMTDTNPTGRFTVSFHIKDLGVYEETMASLKAKNPLFIIVMNDEDDDLPGLNEYLNNYYMINANFHNFDLWTKLPASSTL